MSSQKTISHGEVKSPYASSEALRRLVAAMLQQASATLAQCAIALYRPVGFGPQRVPQLEFYAEAGAPEGALYRDGRLVGWIHGVRRL